jgi:hypothetical protein
MELLASRVRHPGQTNFTAALLLLLLLLCCVFVCNHQQQCMPFGMLGDKMFTGMSLGGGKAPSATTWPYQAQACRLAH